MPIGADTDAAQLHDALAAIGGPLVLRALAERPAAVPQPGFQGSYALLDDGDSPGVMLNTGTVVMLYRLGIDDGLAELLAR